MSNSILDAFGQRTYDESKPMARTFVANVFAYMFAGLAISGIIAWAVGRNVDTFMSIFMKYGADGMPAISPVGYIIMFAPLAVSLVMQMAYHRLPVWALVSLFLAYAVLIGLSLSSIFIVFKIGSIIGIFFITAGLYGAMAVLGYTTKMDLSKFGSIMYMLFIGIFIASLVNIFMKSEGLDWIISIIGVVVFTGLTAVKLQEIRYMSQNVEYGSEPASKLAIIAGLQLYILFINLFITLLRLFGQRNE